MCKFWWFLSICLLSVIFAGCQNNLLSGQGKDVDTLLLSRMTSFGEVEEDSPFTVSEDDAIQLFRDAISSAKKVSGMADVADPQFQIEFGEKTFYLWIDQTHGSVMDSEDTNTLYTIKDKHVSPIYNLLADNDLIE